MRLLYAANKFSNFVTRTLKIDVAFFCFRLCQKTKTFLKLKNNEEKRLLFCFNYEKVFFRGSFSNWTQTLKIVCNSEKLIGHDIDLCMFANESLRLNDHLVKIEKFRFELQKQNERKNRTKIWECFTFDCWSEARMQQCAIN